MNKFFFLLFLYAQLSLLVSAAHVNFRFPLFETTHLPSASAEAGQPLLLTPLIDSGRLNEAQNRSRVPALLANIKSYSGFLTVNKTTKSHLYFWFFEKTSDRERTSSPLILWLQGGPGCSSLYGLFNENGPFKVTNMGLRRRTHAWTNKYNMLYIDQPVGTGFSFTENNGYVSDQKQVADHLYEALRQFYLLFPNMKQRDFYISGESYGGKYVPAIGYKIHTVNQRSQALEIPLKGMMIGNGYSDPENMLGYGEYLHGVGLIDIGDRTKLQVLQDRVRYLIRSEEWLQAYALRDKLFDEISSTLNFSQLYDYTRENFEGDDAFLKYMLTDEVRKKIHVGRSKYDVCSLDVYERFRDDLLQTVRPWIEKLLEHYPILFYSGQLDIIVAHPLSENFLRKLHWSGASKYGSARRQIWRVGDRLAGYYKSAGNLVDVLVRNAGHMVPSDQPRNAFTLVDLFIEKKLTGISTIL